MKTVLALISIWTLTLPFFAPASPANVGPRKPVTFGAAPQRSSEVASIEAYSRTLDRYFKSHPRATRYYVDALPEGTAGGSAGDGKDWHKVRNQTAMLEAEREYATRSIAVSEKDGVIVYADIGQPREHSRRDDGYYFRNDGTLAKIASDYYANIAGVHITRDYFYGAGGRLLRETTQCFQIITTPKRTLEKRASCGRAEMKEELSDYHVPVYTRNTELPGHLFLKGR